jgi:DNA-binding NarL/FixJ family response regulator
MKARILITDDDPTLLRIYRSIFEANDAVMVDYACTRSAGRALLGQHQYELAIFDIDLGESSHDGLDLLDFARNTRVATNVVMISTMDDPPTIKRCYGLGANAFVSKNKDFLQTLKMEVVDLLKKTSVQAA